MRKYQSRRESEVISTITAIFALAVALITSALLPVDIFLVSYMKNQNGTFKVWTSKNVNCPFKISTCVAKGCSWVVDVFETSANTCCSDLSFLKAGY